MNIRLAHLRLGSLNVAIFDADATTRVNSDRQRVLTHLTAAAQRAGLAVDRSALVFSVGARLQYYGSPDLVNHLAAVGWQPVWTHSVQA